MKRIAIFIDGTWNRPDAEYPTNVVRLARSIAKTGSDDVIQHVIYSPGVGAGQGNNRVARFTDRLFGGAFGWGLETIIEDVYRALVFAYEPGDELFIFGFSRGAFAARSLAGLIRSAGIAPPRHIGRIPEALTRYADKYHPDDPKSWEFRADFAPETATSEDEFNWRRSRGDEAIRLVIDYLGVWDTVAALGVPTFVPLAEEINIGYQFHDTKLSSMVLAARHAIAIDERRRMFPAHAWSNLDTLDAGREAGSRRRLQQWFPGDHGSVGGGGPRTGLSSVAMHWVTLGAVKAGLAVNWLEFDFLSPRFDVREQLTSKFGPGGVTYWVLKDRPGPEAVDDLSRATIDRWHLDPTYRPATLDAVYDELYGMDDAALETQRAALTEIDGGVTHIPGELTRPRG